MFPPEGNRLGKNISRREGDRDLYGHFKPGYDSLGNIAAQIIRNIDVINAACFSVLTANGARGQPGTPGRVEEIHTDLLGHRGAVNIAGGGGEGKIDEGQHDTAHDAAFRVPVAVCQLHAADGTVLRIFIQGDAVFSSIPILLKENPGFLQALKLRHAVFLPAGIRHFFPAHYIATARQAQAGKTIQKQKTGFRRLALEKWVWYDPVNR